jgi:two-component system response regulator NreC
VSEPASAPSGISIVIADDHQIVRSGIRLLLESAGALQVVGEAADVPGALRLVGVRRPDVLVLDLCMPGPASLPAIAEVRAQAPGTNVVILTTYDDAAFARDALRSGAMAYVLKDAADDELVAAIRAVAEGRTYVTEQLRARLDAADAAPAAGPPDDLTDRELEILRLIALGHTNAEIAKQLYLSVRTIESHRAHIQQKLRRTTRAELVRYALEHGLLKDA